MKIRFFYRYKIGRIKVLARYCGESPFSKGGAAVFRVPFSHYEASHSRTICPSLATNNTLEKLFSAT
jgi:hypothetical protein